MRQSEALRQLGLGVQLRSLREKAGMTTRSVASALGISRSSVSRTERGLRAPGREEVVALCALFGVIGDEKEALLDRVGDGQETSAWLALGDGMNEQLASLLVLEREAAKITYVELALVPGLAQTADYTRCLLSLRERPERERERRIATRLGRQAVLSKAAAPVVTFFIDESVLHRTFGDERMFGAQLEHLLVLARRDNVRFRVIPLGGPAHPGLDSSFSIYELEGGPAYVFVESQGFAVCLPEPVDVKPFVETSQMLDEGALDEQESTQLIAKAAEKFKR